MNIKDITLSLNVKLEDPFGLCFPVWGESGSQWRRP